jgi:hypothetical protein
VADPYARRTQDGPLLPRMHALIDAEGEVPDSMTVWYVGGIYFTWGDLRELVRLADQNGKAARMA